ncbi:type II and III secretion system protein family protein [Granulosicoccus sp. 3-233]|uniref:type II and III secretion system protein family protein n=1 Tax=Granulosicoccus sp. 3-233 TaxID=3417969 RepID=UPI003D331536
MKVVMTSCVCRVLLFPALLLAGQPALQADANDGWFEVSRRVVETSLTPSVAGKGVDAIGSEDDSAGASAAANAGATAAIADDALLPRRSSNAHARLLNDGWQAIPSIRHPGLQAREVGDVRPAVGDGLASAAVATTTVGQSVTSTPGALAEDPLILSRGEIQEISRPLATLPTRTSEEAQESGQQRRNRLPASAVSTVNVDMFAGEVKVLGKVDVSRVAIGNGDIIRAEVLQTGELLVIGEMEGSTSLRLWHSDKTQSDYNIRVSSSDPETRVRMETMVRMRVRMIEFRKSALGKLGIDWSDSAAGPGFAIAGDAVGNNLFRLPAEGLSGNLPNTIKPFSTYFGVASSITSRINFLASTGDATTLAEPVLSTTNGGSASFLAGGEVPYPSVGANGQTVVQFKEYGIKLNVSPRIDALGNVRTLVETEISQLDPAVSVQGTPGLLTRRAQTQVNVRSGETIVISGLLSAESSKDVDKLPGIGNLPVIGSFFRSKNARNAVSELVIFVTPEIVEPEGHLLSQRQQQFLDRSEHQLSQAHRQIRLLD